MEIVFTIPVPAQPHLKKEKSMWVNFLHAIGWRSRCCNAPFTYFWGPNYKGRDDYTGCSDCHAKK